MIPGDDEAERETRPEVEGEELEAGDAGDPGIGRKGEPHGPEPVGRRHGVVAVPPHAVVQPDETPAPSIWGLTPSDSARARVKGPVSSSGGTGSTVP